jgi:hypothetical protein
VDVVHSVFNRLSEAGDKAGRFVCRGLEILEDVIVDKIDVPCDVKQRSNFSVLSTCHGEEAEKIFGGISLKSLGDVRHG